MKLFIYEHITSGALIDEPLPASLAREGNDMLTAIVQDLAQLSNIELIILRDVRLEPLENILDNTAHQLYIIESADSFQTTYLKAINNADMVLPIAPETGGVLNQIQQQILNSNSQLLASDADAIRLCSDKVLCHQQLQSHGICSPITIKASEWSLNKLHSSTGFIIKPQDGAGCIDTFFMADTLSLEAWLESHPDVLNNMIIQPYIDGLAISLSVLSDANDTQVLAINQQKIKVTDDKLSFLGNIVNGIDEDDVTLPHANEIALKVHQAISGLWGFIGIDLIVHKDDLFVIDINPRLTTSYIGLRQSLNLNPAQLLFTMMEHGISALPAPLQRQAIEVSV